MDQNVDITLTVNGQPVTRRVPARTNLVDFVRYELELTGSHVGCEHGVCGACTVLIDGRPRHACLTLAATCQDSEIETIDGLSRDSRLTALQRGFNEKLGAQCGFCTPGMIMASEALLRRIPNPSETDIRDALAANICRCTGYVKIIEAVQFAAQALTEGEPAA